MDCLPEQLAKVVGCKPSEVVKRFHELAKAGLAKADWEAGVVWVPNRIYSDEPRSPDNIRGWLAGWDEVTECHLKAEAWKALRAYAAKRGKAFVGVFEEVCAHPFPQGELPLADPKPTLNSIKAQPSVDHGPTITQPCQNLRPAMDPFWVPPTPTPTPKEEKTEEKKEDATQSRGTRVIVGGKDKARPSEAPHHGGNGRDEVVMVFACRATDHDSRTEYPMTRSKLAELADTFPALAWNMEQRVRRIRQWAQDNPKKRKTCGGWPKTISSWLDKEHEKALVSRGATPFDKPPTQAQQGAQLAIETRRRRLEQEKRSSTTGDPRTSERKRKNHD